MEIGLRLAVSLAQIAAVMGVVMLTVMFPHFGALSWN